MKTILCYGDSNTYGYSSTAEGLRLPPEKRWTTLLDEALGGGYTVIPEGLNGRTTAYDWGPERQIPGVDTNGLRTLRPCLEKYPAPDVLLFMLGTNDCSFPFALSAGEITAGMEKLLEAAEDYYRAAAAPRILLVAPTLILPDAAGTIFDDQIDDSSAEKSRALAPLYRALAEKHSCAFADASGCEVSRLDCEHLTERGHRQLAELLRDVIRAL